MTPTRLALAALLCGLAVAGPAAAQDGTWCPRGVDKPRIYLIGSSTMGSVLGPMLQGELDRRWSLESKRWGKASSGLARPDFHDWPALAPGLMVKHRPDLVVVSLGTNDNQPLRTARGGWVRMDSPRWAEIYRERVRALLEALSGPDRTRGVIWMGPTAFEGTNARRMGPIINEIMRQEVETFDGPAVFVDAFAATTNKRGQPRTRFTPPGATRSAPARGDDGIHFTEAAVRWLLAEPLLEHVALCLEPPEEPEVAADVVLEPEEIATAAEPGAAGGPAEAPAPAAPAEAASEERPVPPAEGGAAETAEGGAAETAEAAPAPPAEPAPEPAANPPAEPTPETAEAGPAPAPETAEDTPAPAPETAEGAPAEPPRPASPEEAPPEAPVPADSAGG